MLPNYQKTFFTDVFNLKSKWKSLGFFANFKPVWWNLILRRTDSLNPNFMLALRYCFIKFSWKKLLYNSLHNTTSPVDCPWNTATPWWWCEETQVSHYVWLTKRLCLQRISKIILKPVSWIFNLFHFLEGKGLLQFIFFYLEFESSKCLNKHKKTYANFFKSQFLLISFNIHRTSIGELLK